MPDDEPHPGVPTRAIHDAYLDMQGALRQYRDAKDHGTRADRQEAHGNLQNAVVTFYELLRPHLKHNDRVTDYWDGEPPEYPDESDKAPDPEEGKGVLQVQVHRDSVSLDGKDLPDEDDDLEAWAKALGVNGNNRLATVVRGDGVAVIQYQAYDCGLRKLDDWETKYVTTRQDVGGYLTGKTETTTERQRVPVDRLKRAARELSDVAEELTALSDFPDAENRTEITEEMVEDVNEWIEHNLDR